VKIAFLIFDDLTALDAIGPFEVLCRLPGAETMFVAETAGIKKANPSSLGIVAQYPISEVSSADILVVPGGFGEAQVRKQPHMLEWVRKIHQTTQWTTSVCTGSLILGAAGLLKGLPATTHWARLEKLREFGAEPRSERFVESGKIITAAGVSAGIDMALGLARRIAGDMVAHAIQIGIEYDPQPPFDGCAKRAPAPILEMLRARVAAQEAKEAAKEAAPQAPAAQAR
jgi:transcriptional regulator GlxA family with amidase domain